MLNCKKTIYPGKRISKRSWALVIAVAGSCVLTLGRNMLFCQAQGEFIYDAAGRRNPFVALVTPDGRYVQLEKKEISGDIKLEGIIYDNYGVSYAIVNGLVVKIGDFIGDKQVLKIEKNRVFFVKEGQVSETRLKKEE
ncbi:MAG: hypothetical protein WC695_03595 [Candidatus Omnitrophota bacterium]